MNDGCRDEDGELYCRRYTDKTMGKIVPIILSVGGVLLGWGISVETRVGNIATTQQERAPIIAGYGRDIARLFELAHDPTPRPQAKVMLDQMASEHRLHEDRINRLEERFNNFHQFILQVMPSKMVPLSKRGSAPFKPEDQG